MQKALWWFGLILCLFLGSACRLSDDLVQQIRHETPTKSELITGREFPTLVTRTATRTITATPTVTPTPTVTETLQFTFTATFKATATKTATKTAVATITPTRTATRLPTETQAVYATEGGCDGDDFAIETELLGLINSQRAGAGLESVTRVAGLSDVARNYSRQMAENNFFGHGDISARINPAGSYSAVGEILYAGMGPDNHPSSAISAWLNSASHRESLLNPIYTMVGIGYWCDPNSSYGGYYTVDFARP